MREDAERELIGVSSMAQQARDILLELSQDSGCDRSQAYRMAFKRENHLNTAEDFLALLQMRNLTLTDDYDTMAALARQR